MKIKKISNEIIYREISGVLKLTVNGKNVSVSYYRKQDDTYNFYQNDYTIQSHGLTDKEYDYVDEVWEDYI